METGSATNDSIDSPVIEGTGCGSAAANNGSITFPMPDFSYVVPLRQLSLTDAVSFTLNPWESSTTVDVTGPWITPDSILVCGSTSLADVTLLERRQGAATLSVNTTPSTVSSGTVQCLGGDP